MSTRALSRRNFLALSGAAAASLVVAACVAPEAAPAAGEGEPMMETIELNHWGFSGPIWETIWDAVPDTYPNLTVNPTEIGDIVFGDQKFTTAVAAGTGPDTAMQNRHTFLQFAAKGLYQDVTERFDASDLMPGEVGAGSWWQEVTDYVSGASDLQEFLDNVEDSWPS